MEFNGHASNDCASHRTTPCFQDFDRCATFSAVLLASGNSPNAFWETIWRRILRRSTYRSLFSLFLENVFAVCMVYHPPFLGIIFGCVPLDFVDLKNAFPRTRSSENGTLDFLRSLSVPFAFFLRSLSVPFLFLFAFPKRSGNAFPVRLLLSGTVYRANCQRILWWNTNL